MKHIILTLTLCLTLLGAIPMASAQEIIAFNPPTDICAGSSATVSFGFGRNNSIVVKSQVTSLGHSERIFLPDGAPCGNPPSCAYRSPVTFDAFAPGATVTSANDINFVRLNIEHSFAADIYIAITCPNNQRATIMKFGGDANSQCGSQIPSNAHGWSTGNNASGDSFFGEPFDMDSYSYPCDSTDYSNQPGTGWNYCWSNNTSPSYHYASDDGIIYRRRNNGYYSYQNTFDSSNVAARQNFYHPDQNFSALIGCPLNGTWNIEVIDGYSVDNGYIFEWELSLNADLLPPLDCHPEAYRLVGPYTSQLNDSTFAISPPANLANDTTVTYTFQLISSCGDTISRTANVRLHPNRTTTQHAQACNNYTLRGITYTTDTVVHQHTTTTHHCDSLISTFITIHPSFLLAATDTIVQNQLPHTFRNHTFSLADLNTATDPYTLHRTFSLRSIHGCDSITDYTLTVYPNRHHHTDTTLCDNQLPLLWNNRLYHSDTTDTIRLLTTHLADSTLTLNLRTAPSYHDTIHTTLIQNHLPALFNNQTYYRDTTITILAATTLGCDSSTHFTLTVHHNHTYHDTLTLCSNHLPTLWHNTTLTHPGDTALTLTDQFGADSTLLLTLIVHPAYDTTLNDTICDNQLPYLLGTHPILQPGTTTLKLLTTHRCDSTVTLNLTTLPTHHTHLFDTVCARTPYPFADTTLLHPGNYTRTLTNTHRCDSLVTLHLTTLAPNLRAAIKATPDLIPPTATHTTLLDISQAHTARLWTIDGIDHHQQQIIYPIPDNADTIRTQLIAYSPEGCTDTARLLIPVDRNNITLPNTFTPDQPTNRTWQPFHNQLADLELWIYTRQGLLITHQHTLHAAWDGNNQHGNPCPQGTYVYTLTYRTLAHPDRQHTLTGTILLIR